MLDIFGRIQIYLRGIPGSINRKNTNTDLPILSDENCSPDGLVEEYLRAYTRGGDKAPHIKNYMQTGRLKNEVLGKDIPNTDVKGSYTKGNGGGSLHQQLIAGFLLSVSGAIKKLHIAEKIQGWSGVKPTFQSIYDQNQARRTGTTGWLFGDDDVICVTAGEGCGEIHELSQDFYGIGDTDPEKGYTKSDGTANINSRNTHTSITTRSSANDPLGYPLETGIHNRLWKCGQAIQTILDELDLEADDTVFTSDSGTWKLFASGTEATIIAYTDGDLDYAGFPVALLSGVLNKGAVSIILDLFRQPASGIIVEEATNIVNNIWKVKLNGNVYAYVLLTQTAIGAGKYEAEWTVVVRGLSTDTAPNSLTARVPSFNRCGRNFTYTWNSLLGVATFTFDTDSGDVLGTGSGSYLSTPVRFEINGIIAN